MLKFKFYVLNLVILASALAEAQIYSKPSPYKVAPSFQNITDYTKLFRFMPYFAEIPRHRAKMAIFDDEFYGYQSAIGNNLPSDLVYVNLPDKDDCDGQKVQDASKCDDHGRYMGEMTQAMMTNNRMFPQFTPQLYLYNVSTIANFKAAIADAISRHIDVILYSRVKPFGGNIDGRGVWNLLVDKATAAGITWVNAAGNESQNIYTGPITDTDDNDLIALPGPQHTLGFNCPNETCHVEITLTWNYFSDDENKGTDRDLDLILMNNTFIEQTRSDLKQVVNPRLIQVVNGKNTGSILPRESIAVTVSAGQYYIQIVDKSKNFKANDTFRVLLEGAQLDRYTDGESIMVPGDNPNVVTVGDTDSPYSDVSVTLKKPELIANSILDFTDGRSIAGNSNSAAFVFSGFGILKSLRPFMISKELLAYVAAPTDDISFPVSTAVERGVVLTSTQLGFTGTGPNGCYFFNSQSDVTVQNYLLPASSQGAIAITTTGMKIMVSFDPLVFVPGQKRAKPDDAVIGTPHGFKIVPRQTLSSTDWEVFERPDDSEICGAIRSTDTSPGKLPDENASHYLTNFWMPRISL